MKMSRKTLRHAALALLLLGGGAVVGDAGCGSSKAVGTGAGGMTGLGGSDGLGGAPAGGLGGAGGGLALVDWVTDLADNHTNEVSPPDTVADKHIIDTDDPAAFDPLLAR